MAGKAAERIKYYKNPAGPVIASVSRKVIERWPLFQRFRWKWPDEAF